MQIKFKLIICSMIYFCVELFVMHFVHPRLLIYQFKI